MYMPLQNYRSTRDHPLLKTAYDASVPRVHNAMFIVLPSQMVMRAQNVSRVLEQQQLTPSCQREEFYVSKSSPV